MNENLAVKKWNSKFGPGHPVCAEIVKKVEGKTITPAMMIEGKAVVYVDGVIGGPVPLSRVFPRSILGEACDADSDGQECEACDAADR